MDIEFLNERVNRLEQNLLNMADIMERMAKANADALGLIVKLSDILSGKKEGDPRHVLD